MKIIELISPIDNDELDLKKGEAYYTLAHAEGVEGLKKFVEEVISTATVFPIISVNGKQGAVILNANDVGALEVNGTAKSAMKLAKKVKINDIDFDGTQDIVLPIPNLAEYKTRIEKLEKEVSKLSELLNEAVFVKGSGV
ncbi:hypothetical protein QQG09_09415 [Melissococcus plutonius]|uniref:hypothetical protein n=1 Tax=Melissococcus plutonius TaxID=33970 RepID=UPI0021E561D8|nr:hypothetical protein [Melissococcus plutonius]MCV2520646.1 hypothetical protein [Melissococcus plutonius]